MKILNNWTDIELFDYAYNTYILQGKLGIMNRKRFRIKKVGSWYKSVDYRFTKQTLVESGIFNPNDNAKIN